MEEKQWRSGWGTVRGEVEGGGIWKREGRENFG